MSSTIDAKQDDARLRWRRSGDGAVILELTRQWRVDQGLHPAATVLEGLRRDGRPVAGIAFDTAALEGWDSSLLTFLLRLEAYCKEHKIAFDASGLPDGVRRLLVLATAVPERKGARRVAQRRPILERVGRAAIAQGRSGLDMLTFIGSASAALARFVRGRAQFRWSDFALTLQECGAQALGIVTLISFLVGLILAFVGAVQLRQFGAQIFVADLVGIAMVREMGAIMTGIVMAGRTGAAFAAQLGTMQVNEEIDAFSTLGISAMEFLVLPRMLALALMMPLLCAYADLMGIMGGLLIGIGMLDLGLVQYVEQTRQAVDLTNFAIGLAKSAVFGVLVAIAGCMRGMQCGRSASAVGLAATSAVVTGIVFIIVSDAVFAVALDVLGL